jgi:hypothetical protein
MSPRNHNPEIKENNNKFGTKSIFVAKQILKQFTDFFFTLIILMCQMLNEENLSFYILLVNEPNDQIL